MWYMGSMGKRCKKDEAANNTAVVLIPPNPTNTNTNTLLPETRKLTAAQQVELKARYEDIFQRTLTGEEFRDIDAIAITMNGRALVGDEYEVGRGKWKKVKVKKTHKGPLGEYVTEAIISRFCMNPLEDMRLHREYPEVYVEFENSRATRAKEGAINWLIKTVNHLNKRDIDEENLRDISDSYKAITNSLEGLDKMQKRAAAASSGGNVEDPLVLTETIIRELKCDPALFRELTKELAKK